MDEPEILFLHALPLDGSMWDGQREALGAKSIAPTLYGSGETVTEWAEAALSLTQSSRLVLVGCSVGGSCALEIANLAPERVAGMVLIGTKANRRADPLFHAQALRVIREEGRDAAWKRYWRPFFHPDTPKTVLASAYAMMMRQSREDLARGTDVFHTRPGRADLLSRLSCPVVIVSGDQDTAPGLKTSAAQAQMAPNGKLHVIKGSGHYVPFEQPAGLNSLLNEFIVTCR